MKTIIAERPAWNSAGELRRRHSDECDHCELFEHGRRANDRREQDEPPTLHPALEDREPWAGGFAANH